MILYFSSTGNCEFVAKKLAEALNDRAFSILDTTDIDLAAGECLGLVFPTYFWRLPTVVADFFKKVSVGTATDIPYVYFVATYGTTCGQSGFFMKKYLAARKLELAASFSVKTVDDWTVAFDTNDKAKIKTSLKLERAQINKIIPMIKARKVGDYMEDKKPLISVLGSGVAYNLARRTGHLHVNNSCIGCEKCKEECPVSAIVMLNNKPVWIKEQCAMCLHCLHSCPEFAIHYDNKTQQHGQYKHPSLYEQDD